MLKEENVSWKIVKRAMNSGINGDFTIIKFYEDDQMVIIYPSTIWNLRNGERPNIKLKSEKHTPYEDTLL